MPQDFSFNNDIAPMRGSFFQSGLSGREGSYLAKKYGPDKDDMKDMLTMQATMASIRNSDLAYERNLHALQTAKEEYKNERDAYNKLPSLMEDVTDIKNNVDLDPYDKQEAYNSLALRYPHLLTTNKVAGTMVTGAMAANDISIKRIGAEERKANRDLNLIQSAPDARAALEIAVLQDGVSPVEGTMISGRLRREQTAEARAQQAGEKDAKKELTSHLDDQIKNLGQIGEDIGGIKPISAKDQQDEWNANTPPLGDKVATAAYQKNRPDFKPKLSEIDEERVKSHAITLGLHNSIDIDSMDPMQLRMEVLKESNRRRRPIYQKRGLSASTQTTTSSAGRGFKNR